MTDPKITTTAPDLDEIVRVVHLYTDGFGAGDIGMFTEAFHEDAWIFFTDERGEYHRALLLDCFEGWSQPPDAHISGRIISVVQAGDVAAVLLGFDDPRGVSDSWVDLHSLLRIDGVWKITNKTATHATRAGWAAMAGPDAANVGEQTPATRKDGQP